MKVKLTPLVEIPEQLQPVVHYRKALLLQRCDERWIQLVDECRIERCGQVSNLAGSQAAHVVVSIPPAIVAGRAIDMRDLAGQSRGDQGIQCLVHRRQADPWNPSPYGRIDLFGRGMLVRVTQVVVDGGPLPG